MRLGLGGGLGPLKWYVPITSSKKRHSTPMSKKDKEETSDAIAVLLTSSFFWAFVGIISIFVAITGDLSTGGRIGYAVMGIGMSLTLVMQLVSSRNGSKLFGRYKASRVPADTDAGRGDEPTDLELWDEYIGIFVGASVLISLVGLLIVLFTG